MNIPPVKVFFPEEDKAEIVRRIKDCLSSGMLAQGKNVREFEERFGQYVGTRHAVAVSSGGSAIEIVMRILNIKDREVIVPTNTFLATASAVILAGGKVRLADISPDTFCVSLENLKKACTEETVGVIVVHVGGIITPEIEEIAKWCDENGLWLFEDCAHAHGSKLSTKMAGALGIAGAYSFFATKVITSGEGGMIVTDDDDIASRARILRDYGKTEPWVSYHKELGGNWRMSDITGAIGVVQLRRLDDLIDWRERMANIYTKLLKDNAELIPILPKGRCSWYKYILLLPKGADREKLKTDMKGQGIRLSGNVYDVPLHKQPVFLDLEGEFPMADDICSRHICLPLYYGMSVEEAEYVVDILRTLIPEKERK